MQFPDFKTDEALKAMAARAVEQSEQVRVVVRDLTLKALETRDLSLDQVGSVVRSVTEGVNLGAGTKPNPSGVLRQAFSGMDDALLKAVEANRIALDRMTDGGARFEDSSIKKALTELERVEDGLIKGVMQASGGANAQIRQQWEQMLAAMPQGQTMTGIGAASTLEAIAAQMQASARASREMGLKAAHMMTQNYATFVTGVLNGLSEALKQGNKKD